MSKKILIVDDDPGVIHLLEKLLIKNDYEVRSATDGLDGLILIEKEMPDLVILDVMMPEVNGYDVCFKLKFDPKYKHIPVILLTVRDRELNIEIGKEAGIEYIKKPVLSDMLLSTINRMLKEQG